MIAWTQRFRDPVNGLMHGVALLLSLVGTAVLVWIHQADGLRALTTAVYGLSMCGCFLASTLHHLVRGSRRLEMRLLRLDHAAIFPFIAGTYTPVCMHLIPGPSGRALLAVVWAIALGGVVYKLAFAKEPASVEDPPELGATLVYVAMGWLIVWKFPEIMAHSQGLSYGLAVAGGLAYTLGGVILSRRLFDWWPGRLGHHEIWHACVMVGAACLYGYLFLNLA